MKEYYALLGKGFVFSCLSNTKEALNKKIDQRYWAWRGIQGASLDDELKSKEVFLEGYKKVSVIVEELPHD